MRNLKYFLMLLLIILSGFSNPVRGQERPVVDKRLDIEKIKILLEGEVPLKRIIYLIGERGFKIESGNQDFDELRKLGGSEELIFALESTKLEWIKTENINKQKENEK